MTGLTYFNGGKPTQQGMIAYYPKHWIWDGTGIKNGQLFGSTEQYGTIGIAANEVDGAEIHPERRLPENQPGSDHPGHTRHIPDLGRHARLIWRRDDGHLHQQHWGDRLVLRDVGLGSGWALGTEPDRGQGDAQPAQPAGVRHAPGPRLAR